MFQACNRYVAEHLGPCAQCHSPKDAQGIPIESMRFSGDDCFLDIDPMDDTAGCLATPNLTNHKTGLLNRSDAEIKEMMVNGKRPDGSAMFPFMPYWLMHTLSEVDIDSIILYLRTMPAVDHTTAPNQPPFDVPVPTPVPPLAEDEQPMPVTVNDATMRGRASGSGYSKEQLSQLLKTGKDKGGIGICPPMPIGNAYGGLTDTDLSDMADYLLALPAIDNAIPNTCMEP